MVNWMPFLSIWSQESAEDLGILRQRNAVDPYLAQGKKYTHILKTIFQQIKLILITTLCQLIGAYSVRLDLRWGIYCHAELRRSGVCVHVNNTLSRCRMRRNCRCRGQQRCSFKRDTHKRERAQGSPRGRDSRGEEAEWKREERSREERTETETKTDPHVKCP